MSYCDLHSCINAYENEWRANNCNIESIYCDCYLADGCDWIWDCDEIYSITAELDAYYDTNNDGI